MKEDKVIVISYNVLKGGGATLVLDYVSYLLENNIETIVLCPDNDIYRNFGRNLPENRNLRLYYFPAFLNKIYFKPLVNWLILPLFVQFVSGKKVYNLGNVGFPSFKKQFLLMHNAFPVSDDSTILKRMDSANRYRQILMNNFILLNLSWPTVVGVQTKTIQSRLLKKKGIKARLIPNILQFDNVTEKQEINKPATGTKTKLLVLSKYYPHKNLEVLLSLSQTIKAKNLNFQISLTLDETMPTEKKFLEEVKAASVGDVIVNLGNVHYDKLQQVYKMHHGLLLPTLLESFSGTYCESMLFGVPIFTSDRDFAREVCKDAAFYFDPMDSDDILRTLLQAFEKTETIQARVNIGFKLIAEMRQENHTSRLIYESLTQG